MALGTVGQLEQVISQALARPVEAAQAYVRQQAAKNVDETGWKEKGFDCQIDHYRYHTSKY